MNDKKAAYLEEIKNYGIKECTDQKAWFYMDSLIAEIKICWDTIKQQQLEIEQLKNYNQNNFISFEANRTLREQTDLIFKLEQQLQQAQARAERYEKALRKIIDESICRGEGCTWGDTCYAVIARKALESER
jgi:FtsZ-binding cell division protein ZapB